MEQNQALDVLVQAVNLAQKRGTYNLNEASIIAAAIAVFVKEKPTEEPTEEIENLNQKTSE